MAPDVANVSLGLAFGAGVLSILSPCVLCLIPAYITYLAGAAQAENRQVMVHAVLFTLGFSTLFVLYGASASLLGSLLLSYQVLLRKLAGMAVFLCGLQVAGLIAIPGLERARHFSYGRQMAPGALRSFLVGMAFAAGWTPCVGPILGSVLLLAASSQTVYTGIKLLAAYALGMGIPFLLMAFFIDRFRSWLPALGRHSRTVGIVSGLLLMCMGVLLYTNSFSKLARWSF